MTAKELIEQLSKVAPDTEIVGGMFNGRVETYTVRRSLTEKTDYERKIEYNI